MYGRTGNPSAEGECLTLFMAVPTIYAKLIYSYETELSPEERGAAAEAMAGLRLMVSGSAALPVSVMERWREITGHTLLERYGKWQRLENCCRGRTTLRSVAVDGPLWLS